MNPIPTEPLVTRDLHLCELVIVEAQTGKVSLVNLFNKLRVTEFPSRPRSFFVFAALTNGTGDVLMELEIQSLLTGEPIYYYPSVAHFANRLAGVWYRLKVNECSFPALGAYAVNLYANGEPVAQTRLIILSE